MQPKQPQKAMSKPTQPKVRNIRQLEIAIIENEANRTSAVRDALFGDDIPIKQLAEHPLDIMTLTTEKRTHLLAGPKISVIADGNVIIRKDVPIRALMATSTKLHDLLHVKPKVTQFRVYGKIDHKSIERLLDIFTTNNVVEAEKIKLTSTHFAQDILLYQACASLGIYYVHVKPLLSALRAETSARPLCVEEVNTILNRVPPTDPLFKHLANDLCHRRFKKEIPDIVAFEKWLGLPSKKVLQNAMVEIDRGHKIRREVYGNGYQKLVGERM